jgi:hypothetical protein
MTSQAVLVVMPIPSRRPSVAPLDGRKESHGARARATLLIVDRRPDVRGCSEYLATQATTSSVPRPLRRLAAAKQPFDLVLLTSICRARRPPGLARHLRERYAKIAIIMLTGATTVVEDRGPRDGRRRLCAQAVRPARARGARERRAARTSAIIAPTSATEGCASDAASSISRGTRHRQTGAGFRCRRSNSIC